MNRVEEYEKQFKKRYNRDIEVYVDKKVNGNQVIATRKIVSPNKKEYELVDIMDDGKTMIAYLKVDGKTYRYTQYIFAEIHLADLIGDESWQL